MGNHSGLITSEIVTAILAAAIVIATIFGIYVSNQRDTGVDQARQSIANLKDKAVELSKGETPLACDSSLIAPDLLSNDFLTLTVQPTPLDRLDITKGFGVGIQIRSHAESDSGDTFDTAKRLHKALQDDEVAGLQTTVLEDDEIEYSILLLGEAICLPNKPESTAPEDQEQATVSI